MELEHAGDAFLGVECSVTGRRWTRRDANDRTALAIAQRLAVPEVVGRVLAGRGVDVESVDRYLSPTLRDMLPDPSTLCDMDRAAARLADAVRSGERVGIFGDYDVDGATASSLMRLYLESVGGSVQVHIPDRQTEGYGPNAPAFDRMAKDGVKVVVTVDCGTTAYEPLAAAKAAGLDVIVVDHHIAEPSLPACSALINPNRLDDDSGLGYLAAVGVAFMLAVAVNRQLRQMGYFEARYEPDLRRWLDLVALGTVCDMVPLVGLNRALVAQGLRIIGQRTNIGLAALADVANLDGRPSTYHLGFMYGPRINAGGRVGDANLGHRLLTSTDPAAARDLADRLNDLNAERRAIETSVLDQAMRTVEKTDPAPVIVVSGRDWHPGVIGLIASRLTDRYDRPAVAVSLDGQTGKGSARSVSGFDIGAAVTAARQEGLLSGGGGHPMAAGFSIVEDQLAAFEEFLIARRGEAPVSRTRGLGLDGALSVNAAETSLLDTLEQAGPFGTGNPEPRFAFTGVRIVKSDRVGTDHVRCILTGDGGGRLKAIAFRSADRPLGQALLNARAAPVHVAGHLRPDTWQGRHDVQLFVDDLAMAS